MIHNLFEQLNRNNLAVHFKMLSIKHLHIIVKSEIDRDGNISRFKNISTCIVVLQQLPTRALCIRANYSTYFSLEMSTVTKDRSLKCIAITREKTKHKTIPRFASSGAHRKRGNILMDNYVGHESRLYMHRLQNSLRPSYPALQIHIHRHKHTHTAFPSWMDVVWLPRMHIRIRSCWLII